MTLPKTFAATLAVACALSAAPAAADLAERLANADIGSGEASAQICMACHSMDADRSARIGPPLFGIVGAPVAADPDHRYSDAMLGFGGEWTVDRLDIYLRSPMDAIPGNMMGFPGIPNDQDRANLIAYLGTLADTPLTPEEMAAMADPEMSSDSDGEAPEDASETVGDAGPDFGVLVDEPGVEATFYACTACHSEMIVAQQGLTRERWDKLLDWMVEEQGMVELDADRRAEILDYLSVHYGTDRPNFPRPGDN